MNEMMNEEQTLRMVVALSGIFHERCRQHAKWGEQGHALGTWLMILGEEVGELNQAVLETYFPGDGTHGGFGNIRAEAVQVAAVACQIVEYLDRKNAQQDTAVLPS
jgi:NTP pyrophosphatase (non-canonical NTP hydrolase)